MVIHCVLLLQHPPCSALQTPPPTPPAPRHGSQTNTKCRFNQKIKSKLRSRCTDEPRTASLACNAYLHKCDHREVDDTQEESRQTGAFSPFQLVSFQISLIAGAALVCSPHCRRVCSLMLPLNLLCLPQNLNSR